jgi:hypothetical protein
VASSIDIANLALSHLGDSANISDFDEGSTQADHCGRFYPIARDALFEMHDWAFATKRVALAEFSDPPDTAWEYAYALPAGYIKAIAVLAEDAADDQGQRFEIEADANGNGIVFTNVENATMRFVKRIEDTARFSPLFVNALSRLLASYVAGPLIKGSEGMAVGKAQYNVFIVELAAAVGSDSNSRHVVQNHTPGSLQARGVTVNEAYLADGRIIR